MQFQINRESKHMRDRGTGECSSEQCISCHACDLSDVSMKNCKDGVSEKTLLQGGRSGLGYREKRGKTGCSVRLRFGATLYSPLANPQFLWECQVNRAYRQCKKGFRHTRLPLL